MLRDLFFKIWYDSQGTGWFLFVIFLTAITLSTLIFVIARTKLKKQKFTRGHIIFFIISALIIYQIIPVTIHISAMYLLLKHSDTEAINREMIAIKASMIPWQKGGYYCNLVESYMITRMPAEKKPYLDKAYKYVKSYKYPCWGLLVYEFDILGDYDAAIECAHNLWVANELRPSYELIAGFYIKKGDLKNALDYINKDIELNGEIWHNMALKAYILKRMGNAQEGRNLYIKALSLCEVNIQTEKVKNTYADYLGYEEKRIQGILERRKKSLLEEAK